MTTIIFRPMLAVSDFHPPWMFRKLDLGDICKHLLVAKSGSTGRNINCLQISGANNRITDRSDHSKLRNTDPMFSHTPADTVSQLRLMELLPLLKHFTSTSTILESTILIYNIYIYTLDITKCSFKMEVKKKNEMKINYVKPFSTFDVICQPESNKQIELFYSNQGAKLCTPF